VQGRLETDLPFEVAPDLSRRHVCANPCTVIPVMEAYSVAFAECYPVHRDDARRPEAPSRPLEQE